MNEQRKWLLEMKYITGEDAVKIVQVVTKDSRYYLNLIDTAGAQSEKTDSNFFFNFYFYFILLYYTVLVLPYIDMNPPWVYMRSQT